MALIIDGFNFNEAETEKYWSFPASYKKDPKEETRNMIFSGDYIGARKIDGAYYRFIKDMDGNMTLQGRSRGVGGKFLDKIDHVPQLMPFFNSLPNGTCLLGEIYFPNNEGSQKVTTIMGCLTDKAVARQATGDKLHYYVFDIWAYGGKSFMNMTVEKRAEALQILAENMEEKCASNGIEYYTEYAHYFEGRRLWDYLIDILSFGGEGIVITKKGTVPSPGKRTARKTLKVKKEIQQTIDCFFTGRATAPTRLYTGKEIETWKYWESSITGEKIEGECYRKYSEGEPIEPVTKPYFHNWAGSLEIGVLKEVDKSYKGSANKLLFSKDEKLFAIIPIGFLSGLSDEVKANFKNYAGKPIEVTCMEVLETGGLRHAKLVQFRPDLDITECTYEKIFR